MAKEQAPITPGSVTEAYEKTNTPGPTKFDDGRVGEKKKGCKPLVVANTFIGVGVLLAIIAIVYGSALPSVITSKIEDGVAICAQADVDKESYTDQYGDCDDCTPYYYALSMFNVTNAEEYLAKGAKLKVTEVGPYVYRRRQIKVDVKVSDDGNEVSYKQYTYHQFDAEETAKVCATCKDTDQVISWDVSYLNVMSQAGGELGFVRRLATGAPWGESLTAAAREELVQENKELIIRYVNGLNSNQPEVLKELAPKVVLFLAAGPSQLADLKMEGFFYNGLFAKRPISDWALGFPSLLAGLGIGVNYQKQCLLGAKYSEQCAKCKGAECLKIASECKKCVQGARVMALHDWSCGRITAKYAAKYGKEEAETVITAGLCGSCTSFGVCAAPLPGAAEGTGLDYSTKAPNASALATFIQGTGCDDKTKINEFKQYDGLTENPYWVKLDKRRNPTLAELNAFAVYGQCAAKTANMTCTQVFGGDGTSTPPGGASLTGFPSSVELQTSNMYLNNAKQNITLVNLNEVVEYEGVKLTRFSPPNDLLSANEFNTDKGTGYPVDGVQPLAFNVGFLAYLSYPVYIYGDKSLLEGVEITMVDGKVASAAAMYEEDGKTLKKEYYDRYQTTVDVEAGTGKTMRAYKRLMASYALAGSTFTKNAPMSDVMWPKLKAEVISPAYIGEESAIITSKRLDTYNGIKSILGSLLPVLIVGIIVGVGLVGFGFVKRRRAVAASKSAYGDNV